MHVVSSDSSSTIITSSIRVGVNSSAATCVNFFCSVDYSLPACSSVVAFATSLISDADTFVGDPSAIDLSISEDPQCPLPFLL